MKKGFTLAELLITMTIIGVISLLFMLTLKNTMPNKDILMYKKAYSVAEKVIADLSNDEVLFPSKIIKNNNNEDVDLILFGQDRVVRDGIAFEGETKFCKLFAHSLNKNSKVEIKDDACKFITSDGLEWSIPKLPAEKTAVNQAEIIISMDLDTEKGKRANCTYNETTCPRPDVLRISAKKEGKVSAFGEYEQAILLTKNVKTKINKEYIEKLKKEYSSLQDNENTSNQEVEEDKNTIPNKIPGEPDGTWDNDF